MTNMIKELKKPQRKDASEKITDEDMIYFSLGIDTREFILPSQRGDYHTDFRAVQLVENIRRGKRMKQMDFSGVNLKGADISEGHFEDCNFKGAVFYKTNASTCDFTGCCFDEAYMEDSIFDGSDFTNATFKRVFSKNNQWKNAFLDEEAGRYLTVLEKIIKLIEQGKIDIHTLSKSDLLHLDIRRLDFSKIDLEDLDLSMFALDGINLCGTYIDPKQLMSLEGWNSYCLDLRKTKEVTRARLCRRIMTEQEENLRRYAQTQQKATDTIRTKKLKKPTIKQEGTADNRAWGLEKVRPEFVKSEKIRSQEEQKRLQEEQNQNEQLVRTQKNQKENIHTDNDNTITETADQNHGVVSKEESCQKGILLTPDKSVQPVDLIVADKISTPIIDEKRKEQLVENLLNQKNNNQEQYIENKDLYSEKPDDKNIRKEPIKIISHEDKNVDETVMLVENPPSETSLHPPETTIQPTISTTPYPYFLDKSESTETLPLKTDSDDETLHDIQSSGLSFTEMTQILREKGPLKVTSKLPKGRKARTKMKG